MQEISETSGQYFRAVRIIHLAMLIGQLLFLFITIFINSQNGPFIAEEEELKDILMYVVVFFVTAGFISSNLIYKSRLGNIKNQPSLKFKLSDYKGALIVRLALIEGPCILTIIVYLLFGDVIFAFIAASVILYFLMVRPTREKIIENLELSSDDTQTLNDPNSLV